MSVKDVVNEIDEVLLTKRPEDFSVAVMEELEKNSDLWRVDNYDQPTS